MYGISEIQKQNAHNRAEHEHSREGTFCVLQDGSVLLRRSGSSRNLTDKEEVARFLDEVRDATAGQIKNTVKKYWS